MCMSDVGIDGARAIGGGRDSQVPGEPIDSLRGGCCQGRLDVNCEGDAYPSIMSKFMPVGNVPEGSPSSVVQGQPLREVRATIRKHHETRERKPVCEPGCGPFAQPCQPAWSCNPKKSRPWEQPHHKISVDQKTGKTKQSRESWRGGQITRSSPFGLHKNRCRVRESMV
jgi:hypothetical protein